MATYGQMAARLVDLFGPAASAVPTKLLGNLTVSPGGNILVGTSTDSGTDKLQISGTVRATGNITGTSSSGALIASNGSGTSQTSLELIRVGAAADMKTWEVIAGSDNSFAIRTVNDGYTAAAYAMTVTRPSGYALGTMQLMTGGGRVLVATTTDNGTSALQVGGDVQIRSASGTLSQALYFNVANGAYAPQMRANSNTQGIEFVNGANTAVNFTVSDSGTISARTNIYGNGGGLYLSGWSGNANQGVVFLNSAANRYLFYNGTMYQLPAAQTSLSAPQTPLLLTNTNTSGNWAVGPDNSDAFTIYNNNGTGVFVGYGGTAWSANSDERLKNIRESIGGALEAVKGIRTVRYTWKADDDYNIAYDLPDDSRVYAGVIAQDVQKSFPEAVSTNEKGYLGVAYSDLSTLALAAIKELSDKLDAAAARIAELEAQVNK